MQPLAGGVPARIVQGALVLYLLLLTLYGLALLGYAAGVK